MADQPSSRKTVSRRGALKTAAAAGAAAAGGAVIASILETRQMSGAERGPAGAPGITGTATRQLRMVTTWPKNFPGLGTGAERLARRITALSGGRIDVRVYSAGELVPALSAFDAVSQGKADMYHGAEYYWQGNSKAFNFFAAVPFGMTANEINAWVYYLGGQELWDELAGRFNVKPMLAGNSGAQMGGWFKRPILSLADFQGLRIRMPGLGGEVMSQLGATPVTKPGGELFQALDQGNIDATEWVGPWNDMAFGLHTIAANYYYPGIHEPGTALSLGVNKSLWDDFSETERAQLSAAAQAENDLMHAEFEAENARALARLMRDPDVTLRRFDDTILKRMAEVSGQVLQSVANADPFTARVFDSFRQARQLSDRWGDVSERAFATARDFLVE